MAQRQILKVIYTYEGKPLRIWIYHFRKGKFCKVLDYFENLGTVSIDTFNQGDKGFYEGREAI